MSSACLNDLDEQLVIFRNSDGKVLKSMGPRTAKKKCVIAISCEEAVQKYTQRGPTMVATHSDQTVK